LLVCFGGSDSLGIAPRFVDALACEGHRGPATIVVDESQGDVVAATVAGWDDTTVATEMRDMAAAMRDAVLVATKLGLTVLESFCLGNGCVLIEPSTAHLELSKRLESNYPGWPATELGLESATDFADAASKTMALLADTTRLSEMGASGASLVDGCGTQRIVDALVCGSG
jgi:spore coat polysaccharide biosynthesis predicted glycosyltransferase SpsG